MTRSQRPVWLGVDERGWDHARVHRRLLEDPRVGVYELGAYVGLAIHAETESGDARPAAETLAGYLNCGDRRVRTALDNLVAAGWIAEEVRPGKASRYRLLPPPTLAPGAKVRAATPAPGATPPLHEVQPTHARGATELDPGNEIQGTRTPSSSEVAEATPTLPAVVEDSEHLAAARELCALMGELLEARGEVGARRKATTKGWLVPMEAMLRIDGRDPVRAGRLLRWLDAGADSTASFWRTNVRSPEKLRARWAQIEEQVQARMVGNAGSRSAVLHGPGARPLAEALARGRGQGSNGALRSGEPLPPTEIPARSTDA